MNEAPQLRRFAHLLLPDGRRVFAALSNGSAHVLSAPPWLGGAPTGEVVAGVDDEGRGGGAKRLAPVVPSKILCVGRNYLAHAKELGHDVPAEPLLFSKPPSSLLDPDGTIELPPTSISTRVDHEAELGVVVGKRLRRATLAEAEEAIFGLTALGDITARDLQKKDGQWTRAKGMDTFCPVGPVVVAGLDFRALRIVCTVNGQVRQDGVTSSMIFSIPELLRYTSQCITLEPGDVLATGTPEGVGPLADGDALAITIDGIGTLAVRVAAAR
jgi:2-keto-4-pentenoate hydratase/2-oxohepta-3-ene-1,7-dioic acid hydratase in catechol pathway